MSWLVDFLKFVLHYIKEVLVANLTIAWDILTPRLRARLAFIELEIGELSDFQVLLLTNLITMTPGTLSFDISTDRRRLLLHLLYPRGDPGQLRRALDRHYVQPVRRLF
jgi:multicomponent Na+:H+ antiporter subunit E